jgi:hypothetical protein
MKAYIRGVRDYNDALKGGKLAGQNAAEIIDILTKATNIKDPKVYAAITPNGVNPDGKLGEASLLELIDSRRTLLDSRRLYLSALAQAQIDCSRLGALVGEDFE